MLGLESTVDRSALFSSIPAALMILDRNLCFVDMNEYYLSAVRRSRESLIGRYIFDCFPDNPDRTTSVRAAFEGALAGETTVLEEQVFAMRQPDGRIRDIVWNCTQVPVRDAGGAVVGMLQHARDVSKRVAAERMRDIISQEYDHRVRNILAKVSAIARRTARGAASLPAFVSDFEARVSAMARTHQLLVHGDWERLSLDELIKAELAPYAGRFERQVSIEGPEVSLSSRVAGALGMALHELATNAARHGSLSRSEGRLDVRWAFEPDQRKLNLEWQETGMIGLSGDFAPGFGTTIIDQVLPAQTTGSVTRHIAADGLRCTIHIPDTRLA